MEVIDVPRFTYWGIRRRSSPSFSHLSLGLCGLPRGIRDSRSDSYSPTVNPGFPLLKLASKGANNGVPGPEDRGYSRCRENPGGWTPRPCTVVFDF